MFAATPTRPPRPQLSKRDSPYYCFRGGERRSPTQQLFKCKPNLVISFKTIFLSSKCLIRLHVLLDRRKCSSWVPFTHRSLRLPETCLPPLPRADSPYPRPPPGGCFLPERLPGCPGSAGDASSAGAWFLLCCPQSGCQIREGRDRTPLPVVCVDWGRWGPGCSDCYPVISPGSGLVRSWFWPGAEAEGCWLRMALLRDVASGGG